MIPRVHSWAGLEQWGAQIVSDSPQLRICRAVREAGSTSRKFDLIVSRSEMMAALTTLAKVVKPKQASEAALSVSEGTLTIDLPGGSVQVGAVGTWPGAVRIAGSWLLRLSKALPAADPLPLCADEGRLRIAGISFACSVHEGHGRANIETALDAPLHEILRLRQVHGADELEQAGLIPPLVRAEERRDALVAEAAKILTPLAVGNQTLRRFVDECVSRNSAP